MEAQSSQTAVIRHGPYPELTWAAILVGYFLGAIIAVDYYYSADTSLVHCQNRPLEQRTAQHLTGPISDRPGPVGNVSREDDGSLRHHHSSRSRLNVTGACDSPRQLYQQDEQATGSALAGS